MSATTPSLRVLLLMSPATYRAGAFAAAATALGLTAIRGIDLPPELAREWSLGDDLALNFRWPDTAVAAIAAEHTRRPLRAILSVDDTASLLAAQASAALGLSHNDPAAALAARDKFIMRTRLAAAGVPVPVFRRYPLATPSSAIVGDIDFPCVVKPLLLSGSRGVIRANDPPQFEAAVLRLRRMLLQAGFDPEEDAFLVEEYIPGREVAVEGLLTNGQLHVLAIFDKPDPLEGPFFEETIYVTPSRHSAAEQAAIATCTTQAAAALGLREGPVHAELRLNEAGPWLVEVAGRSIGGLCSTVLHFGTGMCLEEMILRQAVGLPIESLEREQTAAGVMMIPIPAAGLLRGIHGLEAARAVEHIEGIEITAPLNQTLVPLPEGSAYLGFIFARAADPATAEAALRRAHACLHFEIRPELPVLQPLPAAVS